MNSFILVRKQWGENFLQTTRGIKLKEQSCSKFLPLAFIHEERAERNKIKENFRITHKVRSPKAFEIIYTRGNTQIDNLSQKYCSGYIDNRKGKKILRKYLEMGQRKL